MKYISPKRLKNTDKENEDGSFAYYNKNPLIQEVFLQRLKKATRFIPNKNLGDGDYVLDIGSGCGFMLPTLSKKGKVVALDYTFRYLEKSKSLADLNKINAYYVNGSIYSLPFKDKQFSLINVLSVLEHIKDTDRGVAEIRRVIEGNGLLIVGVPVERLLVNSLFGLLALKDKLFGGKNYNAKKYRKNKYQDVHYSDFKEIEASLSKYFTIEKTQKIFSNYISDTFSLYKVYKCKPK